MPVESLRPVPNLANAAPNTDINIASVNTSLADHFPRASHSHSSQDGSASPVAPAYSPITPKAQPVLPAYSASPFTSAQHDIEPTFAPVTEQHDRRISTESQQPQQQHAQVAVPSTVPALVQATVRPGDAQQPPAQPVRIPPTEYIPQPPNLPFSGEDSGDAIALRAAISTLQFQKKKAQEDIKTLANIKQLALQDPKAFKQELAAGRLREQKPGLGDLRAILDNLNDDDDDEEVLLGASQDVHRTASQRSAVLPAEIPDSQPSQPELKDVDMETGSSASQKQFPRIPDPQNVVRMPHINWAKYGIVGQALDDLHEQQRRWPGTLSGSGGEKGREYAIAAPYSPWEDQLGNPQPGNRTSSDSPVAGMRKDSGAPVPSATGTISEHVMETRSRN